MALNSWVWAVMVEQQQRTQLPPAYGSGPDPEGGERGSSGDGPRDSEEPVRHVGGGARLFVLDDTVFWDDEGPLTGRSGALRQELSELNGRVGPGAPDPKSGRSCLRGAASRGARSRPEPCSRSRARRRRTG